MSFLSRKAAEALEGIKDGLAAAAHGQTYGQYKREQEEREAEEARERALQEALRDIDAAATNAINDLASEEPRDIQYMDGEVCVKVKTGYSRNTKSVTTDIIAYHRDSSINAHLHMVVDDRGNIIHESWTGNH